MASLSNIHVITIRAGSAGMEALMFQINNEFAYQRIGNKIFIIKPSSTEETLYEFEGDGFAILECILNSDEGCEMGHILKELSKTYILDQTLENTTREFLDELVRDKIIIN